MLLQSRPHWSIRLSHLRGSRLWTPGCSQLGYGGTPMTLSVNRTSRRKRALRVAVVATATLPAALATASALPAQAKPASPRTFEHLDAVKGLTFTPSAQSNRPVTVMLQMQGAPVAQRDASQHLSRKAENV